MNIDYCKTNIVYLNVIFVNYRNLVYLCIITKPKIEVYRMQINYALIMNEFQDDLEAGTWSTNHTVPAEVQNGMASK